MPFFRKKSAMPKRGRKLRKAVRKNTRPSKTFVKKVKTVLHNQAETKMAYHTSSNAGLTYFNSGINSTGDMLQIIPSISQSTADNGRIGDQVRAQSLNLKGYLKFDLGTTPNDTATPTVVARLFIVSLKPKANYTEATSSATALSGLLKKGGSTVAFTGVLSDIYAPVNTDLWTVHHDRKFYLSQSFLNQPAGSGVGMVSVDARNTVKFFNLNVKCKNKLLKYDANISSGLLPVNYGPIFMLGYSYLNGASPDTLSIKLGTQYDATMTYEDA